MASREATNFYGSNNDGACSGLVDSVYESPYPILSAFKYTALAQASAARTNATLQEMLLMSEFDDLPPWMKSSCYEAYRKYQCTSKMLSVTKVSFYDILQANNVNLTWLKAEWSYYYAALNITALFSHEIVLPRLPAREVCTTFVSKCSAYLKRVKKTIPNCDATYGGSERVLAYPPSGAAHTLMNITVRVTPTSTLTLALSSTPASGVSTSSALSATRGKYGSSTFTTICPHGYVVPFDASHPRNMWISGTGCASRCE
jgi:hypothetical protein